MAVLDRLLTGGWQAALSLILEYVPMYTLTPRFIMSIQELYTHDVQGRRGCGIDTGFGLALSGCDADGTAMVYTDVEQNEGLEDIKKIPREVQRDDSVRAGEHKLASVTSYRDGVPSLGLPGLQPHCTIHLLKASQQHGRWNGKDYVQFDSEVGTHEDAQSCGYLLAMLSN
ncbi:hypothetical protein OG21DRAFT_1527251 [Imleria badia]|nr:hypothetical protein OG21DRAFT_1527250 [Imleria badia]KAF8547308.1 hypothetical protein OG21DRAFT_1527251 [Imleria badia]